MPDRRADEKPAESAIGVTYLAVSPEEAGQKLLAFLQRRVGRAIPQSAVMRWIRTGQVRVNKGRAKPFDRVREGDVVRVPPHAAQQGSDGRTLVPAALAVSPAPAGTPSHVSGHEDEGVSESGGVAPDDIVRRLAAVGLPVVGHSTGLLVLRKPAGLPVQPGTGHADAVTARLAVCFQGAAFMPTPAHRLDRDTSGLLLVATSYTRLRALHDALRDSHAIRKTYLAWVRGTWPEAEAVTLRDVLYKGADERGERMLRQTGADARGLTGTNPGKTASCTVVPVLRGTSASLLAVALHTGRTHQIRVQLAERGHPLVGDGKYGPPARVAGQMLLHAWRLVVPAFSPSYAGPVPEENLEQVSVPCGEPRAASGCVTEEEPPLAGASPSVPTTELWCCLPDWPAPYSVPESLLAGVSEHPALLA